PADARRGEQDSTLHAPPVPRVNFRRRTGRYAGLPMANKGAERRRAATQNPARRTTAIVCIAFLFCLPPVARAESPATPPDCVDETANRPPDDSAEDPDEPAAAPSALQQAPGMALTDAVCVLGSPVHWGAEGWMIAAGSVAGIVLVGAFADELVRDHWVTH